MLLRTYFEQSQKKASYNLECRNKVYIFASLLRNKGAKIGLKCPVYRRFQ